VFEISLKFRYAGSVAGLGDWEGAVVAGLRAWGSGWWIGIGIGAGEMSGSSKNGKRGTGSVPLPTTTKQRFN
jgi:hypothetical protein